MTSLVFQSEKYIKLHLFCTHFVGHVSRQKTVVSDKIDIHFHCTPYFLLKVVFKQKKLYKTCIIQVVG